MNDEPDTIPSDETLEADRKDASAAHEPDRPASPDEEADAPGEVDPKAAEAYKEAMERGAAVKGEGQI